MNAVIVGGTKGMGRALARLLSERGSRVFLLGRDEEELARSAADLAVRASTESVPLGGPSDASAVCDLERPETFDAALDLAQSALGHVDLVVMTAARFNTQDELEEDEALLERLLSVNFTNTILFCEKARKRLIAQGGGTLCVFSSVAGERGRKPVALYGAAKAGLSRYLEALDHRYHDRGLHVLTVKPGFVHTGMTAGLEPPPFAGEPDAVAREVLRAIEGRRAVVYTPRIWALVMMVIRWLPRAIMRRVSF